MMKDILPFETVVLDDEDSALVIIDQTRLPNETVTLRLRELADIREAIRTLQVRGAPAIGVAAAFGLYLVMKKSKATSFAAFAAELQSARDSLNSARPTAVNLSWALERMEQPRTGKKNSRFKRSSKRCVTNAWRSTKKISGCASRSASTG